ncbi:hypothetical protein O6H91_09G084700 [Diphasiastrum complanatum]|uniref:Uncharacterized protein n=1 Tax=Diphasiastrum complanatum TaxID=34168 RepID=A0ACC2CRN2_DIPCM|nr:hypothetical protein O6H91_09G084700 [Diphasiastrum complanatum]
MGREVHGQEEQQQQSSGFEQTYGGDLFALWSESFGDHCHHGYYENHLQLDGNGTLNEDSFALAREAAVRLIDKLLLWANIPADGGGHGPQKILDVGMGLGAASRYFGKRFPHATVQGISLAKVEVEIATKLTASQNLSDKVSFLYADARTLPFPNNEYDLVWCLECADHILEREQLMKELARVTAPGGKIVLTTMCNRELLPHEKSLSESEKEVLENIFSDDLAVASWSQPSLYLRLAEENGLEAIQSDNWTKYVTPGVPIWIHFYKNSDLSIVGVKAFSMALPALMKAYEQGLVEYFVFKAVKPSS